MDVTTPLEFEEGGSTRRTCGVLQVRRPALFDLPDCLIKEPPSAGVTAPCSDYEFHIIEKYVERANALKGASTATCRCLLMSGNSSTSSSPDSHKLVTAAEKSDSKTCPAFVQAYGGFLP